MGTPEGARVPAPVCATRPIALFCSSDLVAFGALVEARRAWRGGAGTSCGVRVRRFRAERDERPAVHHGERGGRAHRPTRRRVRAGPAGRHGGRPAGAGAVSHRRARLLLTRRGGRGGVIATIHPVAGQPCGQVHGEPGGAHGAGASGRAGAPVLEALARRWMGCAAWPVDRGRSQRIVVKSCQRHPISLTGRNTPSGRPQACNWPRRSTRRGLWCVWSGRVPQSMSWTPREVSVTGTPGRRISSPPDRPGGSDDAFGQLGRPITAHRANGARLMISFRAPRSTSTSPAPAPGRPATAPAAPRRPA